MASSRDHTRALLEFLRDDPALVDVVFDGYVKGEAPPRYVIVFAQSLGYEVDRLAGNQRGLTVRHTIHSVGQIPSEAQWLADKVAARLVNARIPVTGRKSGPVRHESADPLRTDPPVYFLADDYVWESTP